MKATAKSIIWITIVLLTCTGFRIYSGFDLWQIDNSSATARKLFFVFPNDSTAVTNDLPSNDPSAGAGTITVDALMTSIFNDYNNINASFLTLVNDSDADFGANGTDRTVTVEIGGTSGTNSGQAQFEVDGTQVVGCTISMGEDTLDSAKEFVRVMTHEIGHCIGLRHPQDTVNAIMSYFGDPDKVRLQIDDKMGIVHLYPVDPSAADEKSTFGFSCATAD